MISDLDRSLGSRYFRNVANERTCFASSLVWNTLLTKKLPMFLSRMNENIGTQAID